MKRKCSLCNKSRTGMYCSHQKEHICEVCWDKVPEHNTNSRLHLSEIEHRKTNSIEIEKELDIDKFSKYCKGKGW